MVELFNNLSKPIENDSKESATFEGLVFTNKPYSKENVTIKWIYDLVNKYSEFNSENNKIYKDKEIFFTLISYIKWDFFNKRSLFDEFNLDSITDLLGKISELIGLSVEISQKVQNNMNTKLSLQQKEFILREKVKVLQEELSNINVPINDDDYSKDLKDSVRSQIYPDSVKTIIAEETKRSSEMILYFSRSINFKNICFNFKKILVKKNSKRISWY
ncbi:hypothetical protein [Mycoplasmopsis cynos]|uniref:hypothetical protein n=1 Tax=Mycoplasmopsis cynos TaxID=171284 RepID=UPI003A5C8543